MSIGGTYRIVLSSKNGDKINSDTSIVRFNNIPVPYNAPNGYSYSPALTYARIPSSFYNVNTYNNTLVWIVTNTSTLETEDFSISVTPDFYTLTTLITQFNLQTAASGAGYYPTLSLYKVDNTTLTANTDSTHTVTITNSTSTILKMLGQDDGSNILLEEDGGTINSLYVADLTYTSAIYIMCNELPSICLDSRTSSFRSNILEVVPNSVSPGEIIHWSPEPDYGPSVGRTAINTLTIQIEDDKGKVIGMNGADWLIVLSFMLVEDASNNPYLMSSRALTLPGIANLVHRRL